MALKVYKSIMHFKPEFMWNYFTTNPIPCNFRKESRLPIPPAESVNFGVNSLTFRGSLSYSLSIDEFKFEQKNFRKIAALVMCVIDKWFFLYFYFIIGL